ncbi:MAG: AraC family transcriptional regulator [Saprospiraceae bacterium]|nr:AraC family transcriptional regulator [Saprospiraceae bacterium]
MIHHKTDMRLNLRKYEDISNITFVNNRYTHHQFTPHYHDEYLVLIVDEGVNGGVCQKTKYQVASNEVLLMNPGEIHTGYSLDNKLLSYRGVYIEPAFFKHLSNLLQTNSNYLPDFTQLHIKNPFFANDLRKMIFTIEKIPNPLAIQSVCINFFENLLKNYATLALKSDNFKHHKPGVKAIQDFIHAHYDENFSLDALSRAVNLSPFHLIRLFKKEIGIAPYEYLRNYRIERAKQLLRNKHSITETALSVGFYDQSHFHHCFRKLVGVTPKTFRSIQQ